MCGTEEFTHSGRFTHWLNYRNASNVFALIMVAYNPSELTHEMKYSCKRNWNHFCSYLSIILQHATDVLGLSWANVTEIATGSQTAEWVVPRVSPHIYNRSDLIWLVWLTIFSTCWEKLWLTKVASSAKFLGEFKLAPSSWGGSVAVSLTVNRSTTHKDKQKLKLSYFHPLCFLLLL